MQCKQFAAASHTGCDNPCSRLTWGCWLDELAVRMWDQHASLCAHLILHAFVGTLQRCGMPLQQLICRHVLAGDEGCISACCACVFLLLQALVLLPSWLLCCRTCASAWVTMRRPASASRCVRQPRAHSYLHTSSGTTFRQPQLGTPGTSTVMMDCRVSVATSLCLCLNHCSTAAPYFYLLCATLRHG